MSLVVFPITLVLIAVLPFEVSAPLSFPVDYTAEVFTVFERQNLLFEERMSILNQINVLWLALFTFIWYLDKRFVQFSKLIIN